MSTLWAILAVGALIVVHEAGHFVVARLCGMKVERFSIGFGPALLSWRRRKEGTLFQLAPIPFGGFVEIKGMNIVEDVDPTDAAAYPNRPAWQRFVTIFAGPATNYLFAVVLALILFGVFCKDAEKTAIYTVDSTEEGFDAFGKLEKGDRFVAVNGDPLVRSLSDVVAEIGDGEAVFTVDRGGQSVDVKMHPKKDDEGRYRLGVGLKVTVPTERHAIGFGRAIKESIIYPFAQTKLILVGLYEWISGKQEGRVSSVVGITQVVKHAIEESWVAAVELLMILNVYLGLINLFPLPALDGGRLVFLSYEMVTRRRANPKLEATIHMVGVLVLAVLLVVVTVNDCRHL